MHHLYVQDALRENREQFGPLTSLCNLKIAYHDEV